MYYFAVWWSRDDEVGCCEAGTNDKKRPIGFRTAWVRRQCFETFKKRWRRQRNVENASSKDDVSASYWKVGGSDMETFLVMVQTADGGDMSSCLYTVCNTNSAGVAR